MIAYFKRLTIRNLMSPYGLAMISYVVFLFAWLFPPDLYTTYIHEPDWMFLDLPSFIFYTLCTVAFAFGVRFSVFFGTSRLKADGRQVEARQPLLYLLLPLLVSAACGAIYLIKVGAKINFIGLLASAQGSVIKTANGAGQMSEGRWDESIPLLTVVLWWSLYRALQLELKGAVKALFYAIFFPSLALGIFMGVATVNRANLMPIVLGTFAIYTYFRTRKADIKVARLALLATGGSVVAVFTFLFLSFLRGALAVNLLITSLLGYTITSYNRLTALLLGAMHFAYEGHGVYLVPAFLGEEKVNYVFDFAGRFSWPSSLGLFQSEFLSTSAAGLNPAFIWAGAFGYVFSDLGWATPLYWIAVGVLAGRLWINFCAGRSVGLVLYPWIAFSILMWCGGNFVFRTNFIQYCEFAVGFAIYDHVCLRKTRLMEDEQVQPDLDITGFNRFNPRLERGWF